MEAAASAEKGLRLFDSSFTHGRLQPWRNIPAVGQLDEGLRPMLSGVEVPEDEPLAQFKDRLARLGG